MGSALAILLFYPLERVRIELQSSVDSSADPSEHRSGRNDHNLLPRRTNLSVDYLSNMLTSTRTLDKESGVLENRLGGGKELSNDISPAHSHAESYDLVSLVKNSDASSFGTLSNEACSDNEEQLPNVNLGEQQGEQHVEPANSDDSVPIDMCSALLTSQHVVEDSHPPSSSTSISGTMPAQKNETSITQCLLRLYAEKSLYKGASHMVTTWMISNAIFFYALQVIRERLSSPQKYHGTDPLHLRKSLIASTIAGCINVVLTNPLWVACIRVLEGDKTLAQHNIWSVMYQIMQTEGTSQLWNGTSTSLLLVSNPIIQHFVYEQLRSWLLLRKQAFVIRRRSNMTHQGGGGSAISPKATSLSPAEAFVCGALAKALSTGVTYPLQLAQTLLRLQKKMNMSSSSSPNTNRAESDGGIYYEGTFDCLYKQVSAGGIRALFYGMNAKMLQTVVTAAFQFLTYEQILTPVGRIYDTITTTAIDFSISKLPQRGEWNVWARQRI